MSYAEAEAYILRFYRSQYNDPAYYPASWIIRMVMQLGAIPDREKSVEILKKAYEQGATDFGRFPDMVQSMADEIAATRNA